MANIKVSEMTEATSFDDGDYTMIVQANQNKKISKENLLKNPAEFIVVTISNSQTVTSNSQVEFDAITRKNGNFTLSNGAVVIGEGINHIRISGSIFVDNWAGSTNYLWATIRKNNAAINSSINGGTSSYLSGSVPFSIIDVQENDVISLVADSPSGGNLRNGFSNTWLCVEKID